MGNCQYKVADLQASGLMALNATTLEPWPLFDTGSSLAYGGGWNEEEHLVLEDQAIRFQCINTHDVILDVGEGNEPILDEQGLLANFVVHVCKDTDSIPYSCYDAPSAAPTVSAAPTRTPMPTSAPSQSPSAGPTTSASPTATPSQHPSLRPSRSPSALPSSSPSWEPSSFPSQSPTRSSAPSSNPSSAPSTAPSQQSMTNSIAIDTLRNDVQSLSVLRETDNLELMNAIEVLTQRLDAMETLLQESQARTNSNTQQISNLRGYTQAKIVDTQYWVSRCWWYNTQQSINWND